MKTLAWFLFASFAEIAGCFSFWAWLRQGKHPLWLVPGILSLIVFAFALTRVDSEHAGRAYATYGGIYIVSSLAWLCIFEGARPDKWDVLGAAVCLLGSIIIQFGPRGG